MFSRNVCITYNVMYIRVHIGAAHPYIASYIYIYMDGRLKNVVVFISVCMLDVDKNSTVQYRFNENLFFFQIT